MRLVLCAAAAATGAHVVQAQFQFEIPQEMFQQMGGGGGGFPQQQRRQQRRGPQIPQGIGEK